MYRSLYLPQYLYGLIRILGEYHYHKSAIVDSIDLLLTGKISRLVGKGTRGISLKSHGTHIDHKPKEAVVTAKIKVDGCKDIFVISRKMNKPNDLICEEKYHEFIAPIIEIAQRGQHVLTRREILRFVTSSIAYRLILIQNT